MADISLAGLDAMSLEEAWNLSFEDRDKLLDLVVKDGLRNCGKQPERQVGLMSDYFEESKVRMLKVKASRVRCGGFIPVGADGEVPKLDPEVQFKIVFENIKGALEKAGTSIDRITNMKIFMTDMRIWKSMNNVYKDFIKCCPTRAAIGTHSLNKEYIIEVTDIIAWKVDA